MSMGFSFSHGMQLKHLHMHGPSFVIGMLPLFNLSPAQLSVLEAKLSTMGADELNKFGGPKQEGTGRKAFYDFKLEECIRRELSDTSQGQFPQVTFDQQGQVRVSYQGLLLTHTEKPIPIEEESRGTLIRNAQRLLEAVKWTQNMVRRTYEEVASVQADYLSSGDRTRLVPLKMKDIAAKIGVTISTVSRLVKNKSLVLLDNTEIPLVNLFVGAEDITREKAYRILRPLIAAGNYTKTDIETTELLRENGVNVARRTVNKYLTNIEREYAQKHGN